MTLHRKNSGICRRLSTETKSGGASGKEIRKEWMKYGARKGAKTREEYLEEQKEKTEDRVWQMQKAMERHPNATNKQLAEMLQLSVRRIQQLKKMITN